MGAEECRVDAHLLGGGGAAGLAEHGGPAPAQAPAGSARRAAWLHRFGWDAGSPPVLASDSTRIRKVEFADAKDLKEWMWKGIDGIAETTWPGVYNRSRPRGREDDFELPGWNPQGTGKGARRERGRSEEGGGA